MIADRGWRYELKMSCNAIYLAQARSWIRLHSEGFHTAFPPRTVNNLYLDTPDLNSYDANIQGVGTRQKLRLRWYGRFHDPVIQHPVLELKYKDNMLGNKKQEKLVCELDLRQPYSQLLSTIRQAASPQWRQWLDVSVQPALVNRYHREYYVSRDGVMRATLDSDLVVLDQRRLFRPNLTVRSLLPPAAIIEIKSAPDQMRRLETIMAEFPLPRMRYSKYVNGVMAGNL
jgi:hypothetical protein